MVLTYDLLEDRCTIDVIITKFFPLCFEMAESFENLDNVLHDWGKDEVQKSFCYEKIRRCTGISLLFGKLQKKKPNSSLFSVNS